MKFKIGDKVTLNYSNQTGTIVKYIRSSKSFLIKIDDKIISRKARRFSHNNNLVTKDRIKPNKSKNFISSNKTIDFFWKSNLKTKYFIKKQNAIFKKNFYKINSTHLWSNYFAEITNGFFEEFGIDVKFIYNKIKDTKYFINFYCFQGNWSILKSKDDFIYLNKIINLFLLDESNWFDDYPIKTLLSRINKHNISISFENQKLIESIILYR